jgi:hypothetical protein
MEQVYQETDLLHGITISKNTSIVEQFSPEKQEE